MYNRYVPQPDGTYRRNRMQEVVNMPEKTQPPPPPPPVAVRDPEPSHCSSCIHSCLPRRPAQRQDSHKKGNSAVSSFLKQLIPKDFEVEDLLVVLLLLLMSGDCQENQNTALLTLVLYLFL